MPDQVGHDGDGATGMEARVGHDGDGATGMTGLEVRVNEETVWLTQAQMSDLFGRDRSVITKHIRNIFTENELDEKSNVHFLHFANSDKPVKLFSLDFIRE